MSTATVDSGIGTTSALGPEPSALPRAARAPRVASLRIEFPPLMAGDKRQVRMVLAEPSALTDALKPYADAHQRCHDIARKKLAALGVLLLQVRAGTRHGLYGRVVQALGIHPRRAQRAVCAAVSACPRTGGVGLGVVRAEALREMLEALADRTDAAQPGASLDSLRAWHERRRAGVLACDAGGQMLISFRARVRVARSALADLARERRAGRLRPEVCERMDALLQELERMAAGRGSERQGATSV
jgi:hypothetical protein